MERFDIRQDRFVSSTCLKQICSRPEVPAGAKIKMVGKEGDFRSMLHSHHRNNSFCIKMGNSVGISCFVNQFRGRAGGGGEGGRKGKGEVGVTRQVSRNHMHV